MNVYRQDRETRGGGTAVAVDNNFQSMLVPDICDAECDSICVKVMLNPTKLVAYVAYVNKPDHAVLMKHYSVVNRLMSTESESRIVVLGDFNLHDIVWNPDQTESYFLPQNVVTHTNSEYFTAASDFLQSIQQLPMYQLSNAKNIASNVLDLVFANGFNDIKACQAPNSIHKVTGIVQFHPPLEISFEYHLSENPLPSSDTMEVFLYKKGNYARINQRLSEVNFAQLFDRLNVDEAFDCFYDLLNQLIVDNIPKVRVKKYNNKPKWWTTELQKKKNRRDKTYKRKPKDKLTPEYEIALNEFNELQNKLFLDYIGTVQANICQDPKQFWSYAKTKQKRSVFPSEMVYNDKKATTPGEIVELFADHFENSYTTDSEPFDFDDVYAHEPPGYKDVDLSMFDIEKSINDLENKNNCGPDSLSPIFVKSCVDNLVWPLWILYRKTQTMGLPQRLKYSRVVPVFKKGDKSDVKNYRIVAISSVILIVYEMGVQLKLMRIVNPRIRNPQHGFRPKRSVVSNLMNLSIAAYEAFDKSYQLDVFYGDFKTAFDRVVFRIFITKLWTFGVGKMTAMWLFNFLTGRKFFVKIGDFESRTYEATSGVPAGSILGPLLFLISIDDISLCVLNALVLLFADDIKIASIIRSAADTRAFQNDINNLIKWCDENGQIFHREKCFIITIARTEDYIEASYKLGDHAIERKEEICDLGCLVDKKFTFGGHREQITTKARQMMGYIKKISNGQFGINALKVLYTSYVRSRLEFASVIWDPHSQVYRDEIESIQKQFVMYAMGENNRIPPYVLRPYEERCRELGLETLLDRRNRINVLFAYNLYNDKMYDTNFSDRLIGTVPAYHLRRSRLVVERVYRRDYEYNQPFAKMIRLINKFSAEMRLSESKFKTVIKSRLLELREDGQ